MEEKGELLTCLGEKINSGKATIDRLKLVGKIDGIEKLIRKIQQEIRFLEKVCFLNYKSKLQTSYIYISFTILGIYYNLYKLWNISFYFFLLILCLSTKNCTIVTYFSIKRIRIITICYSHKGTIHRECKEGTFTKHKSDSFECNCSTTLLC